MMTGSNFDDTTKLMTGGRHGYGAKLANIFSTEFTVDTVDSKRGLRFTQRWVDNMSVAEAPEVRASEPGATDYTEISFVPDLARLGDAAAGPPGGGFDADNLAFMRRRVLDVAACAAPVRVSLDGARVDVDSFEAYMKLYVKRGRCCCCCCCCYDEYY